MAFTFAISGFAQKRRGDIELGASIGLNISNISGNTAGEDFDDDSSISFNVTGVGEYYFSDSWGVKAKVIYDRKGSQDANFDFSTNLDYITIPVTANWHFGRERNWYVNFGLYAGVLANAEFEVEEPAVVEEPVDEEVTIADANDIFKSSDFGLAFGVGVRFPIDYKTRIFIEYDGQTGIANIADLEDETIRNGRSSINVGILFDL